MNAKIHDLMTESVVTVEPHTPIERVRRIHRLVVTHEQKGVGILSAFDLLELVQGHRWAAKNPPSASRRKQRASRA